MQHELTNPRRLTGRFAGRAPLEQSRKWGVYYIANLIFKTCFRLRSASSVSLCNSVLVALTAGRGDVPELQNFPKAQQVTFMYYRGILQFLEEKYIEERTALFRESSIKCDPPANLL